MSAAFAIQHVEESCLFETWRDGHRGVLTYRLDEGAVPPVMTIDHTGVPVVVRGQGMAAALVAAAFDVARQRGWRVQPACSYAAAWAHRHADATGAMV